jgi:RND family efflux transporter MFP subunit
MKIKYALPMLSAALFIAGCSEAGDHGHDHGGGHDDHGGGHGGHDDHGGGEIPSEAVTRWGESTQLFVEFPALVVGEESRFAAHLTGLDGHVAIDSGGVLVVLSGGGGPDERFVIEGPSVAGIFRPVVRPAHAGRRSVTLRLTSDSYNETHDMGEFDVFPTVAAAIDSVSEEPDGGGQISYLLEQQWRVPFHVEVATVRPMRPSIPAFASLEQPPEAESVMVAPHDGRIADADGSFPVLGQSVDAGAVLFQLTTAPQSGGDLASLVLAIEQAEIRASAAQREIERLSPLLAQGVVPERRIDEARSMLAAAESELRGARRRRASYSQSQRVDGARDALDLPAPLAGSVAELFVSPGTWVAQGEQLVRIVDTARLTLSVGVAEAYLGRVTNVSGAWARLDGGEGVIDVPRSALVSIGTEIDQETRTLPVRFSLENDDGRLFAGMHMQANLIVDEPRTSTAVPLTAVVDDSGTDVVYVQAGGESFERRAVRLGIQDGDYIEVTDGVEPGEWVVSEGAYAVKLASTSTESIGHGHAH